MKKQLQNEKRKKAKNAFQAWASSRKRVKSIQNQASTNLLEKTFVEADPRKGPSTVEKIKKEHPTSINTLRNRLRARKESERIGKRNENIRSGRTTLPPFPRPMTLRASRIENIRTKGIAAPQRPARPPLFPRKPVSLAQKNLIRRKGIVGAVQKGMGNTRKRRNV